MSGVGMGWAGVMFASRAEMVVAALLLLPLLIFVLCVFYLLLLLLNSLPMRKRVVDLSRPEPVTGVSEGPRTDSAASVPTASLPPSSVFSGTPADNRADHEPSRFVLLIPAHNEEMLLGAALTVLQQMQYPRDRYEIVVIADNCSDSTALIARNSGALALERSDKARIGKGYALEDTLDWLLTQSANETARGTVSTLPTETRKETATLRPGAIDLETSEAWRRAWQFDAVVILDADTFVSSNLLSVFTATLRAGQTVVQARYDVFNTDESWRTRLMSCALALAHVVKPLGRERLRLSDGLKGNGMCFARSVVVQVPWSGESITEDIEYTLRVCREGHRVAFVPEACVWAQMPTSGAQAASQRQRWEGGRYRLLFKVAPQLLAESFRTKNRLLRDRAIELVVPPFAEMFALPAAFGVLCGLLGVLCRWHVVGLLAFAWAALLVLQAVYLFGGMWVARVRPYVALSLLFAPFYIVWKLGLYGMMALGRSAGGWKRTERHELGK